MFLSYLLEEQFLCIYLKTENQVHNKDSNDIS